MSGLASPSVPAWPGTQAANFHFGFKRLTRRKPTSTRSACCASRIDETWTELRNTILDHIPDPFVVHAEVVVNQKGGPGSSNRLLGKCSGPNKLAS
jgi:hypothetical protein